MKKKIFYSLIFVFSFFIMIVPVKGTDYDGFSMKCSYASEDEQSAYNLTIAYAGENSREFGIDVFSSWKTDGTITKYKGEKISQQKSAVLQNQDFTSGTCPSHAYIIKTSDSYFVGIGDQVYVTTNTLGKFDFAILKLNNNYNTNKENEKKYNNLPSETACSYAFGKKKISVKVPKAWYEAAIALNGGITPGNIIVPGTCPKNVYYICKTGSSTDCSYSLSLTKPSLCSEPSYVCYQLPDENPVAEDKSPIIKTYTQTYHLWQEGNTSLADKLTFTIKYDHKYSEYKDKKMQSGSSTIDIVATSDSFLDYIVNSGTFPENIYCAKLDDTIQLSKSAKYIVGKGNGAAVCSTRRETFVINGQITVYSKTEANKASDANSNSDVGTSNFSDSADGANSNSDVGTSNFSDSADGANCGILGPKMVAILSWFVKLIRLGVPILVIILGMIDFLRILFSGEDKVYKDAFTKFVKRLIIGVIIIFVPYIIQFVIKTSGVDSQYGIDSFYCGIISASGATGSGPTEIDEKEPYEYTDANSCEAAGNIYNSVSGVCVKGTGNNISISDCTASGYQVVNDSSAPGGYRCVIK